MSNESEVRIEAAQEWLKRIELEYGEDVADQCESILLAAESRRAATEDREKAIAAMWAHYWQPIMPPDRAGAAKTALGLMYDDGYRRTQGGAQ